MTTAGTIRTVLTALATLLLTLTTSIAQETRPVDVVVMLDTSGSMENLLDATRARLWDVVNEVGSIQIATPQDDLLLELNASLNTTYVPYGEKGAAGLANQVAVITATGVSVETSEDALECAGDGLIHVVSDECMHVGGLLSPRDREVLPVG